MAVIHVITGLFAMKGASWHRRSGMVLVWMMQVICAGGGAMAALWPTASAINLLADLLTAYLVVSGYLTVLPPVRGGRSWYLGRLLLATGLAVTCLGLGFSAAMNANGRLQGFSPLPYFLFCTTGTFAAIGDLRMLLAGMLQGVGRIARHLWRMCFAMLVATMSLFLGQTDDFPEALRILPLLAAPVVLLSLLYWLWRVRVRRNLRGMTMPRAQEAVLTPRRQRPARIRL